MARSGGALVGLLAEKSQYRNHGRASAGDLHAAVASTEREAGERSWILAGGAGGAGARCGQYNSLFAGRSLAFDRSGEAGDASTALHSLGRSGSRNLGGGAVCRSAASCW